MGKKHRKEITLDSRTSWFNHAYVKLIDVAYYGENKND
jgi:hypothetical protein